MSSKVSQLTPRRDTEQGPPPAIEFILGGQGTNGQKKQDADSTLVPIHPATDEESFLAPGKTGPVPIRQLVAKKQHRTDFDTPETQAEIAALAENIREFEMIQPIVVRHEEDSGKFEIIAGERRYRAAQLIGLEEVPCVRVEVNDGGKAALQLAENVMREDLNPIDEAKAYKEVMELNNWSQPQVARIYGKNKSTISRSLMLLELPEAVQEKVASGAMSANAARELADASDDQQTKLAAVVSDKSLTAKQTRELVQKRVGKPSKRKSKSRTRPFAPRHGKAVFTVDVPNPTYHHLEEMALDILEEVRHCIKNGRDL